MGYSQLWDDYNQIELVVQVFSDRFGRLVLELPEGMNFSLLY